MAVNTSHYSSISTYSSPCLHGLGLQSAPQPASVRDPTVWKSYAMGTIDEMEAALAVAIKLGYRIRYENLRGQGGGSCEIAGRRWLFVDLTLSPGEQLLQVRNALRSHVRAEHAPQGDIQSVADGPRRAA
jgi:hypothetical protein